MKKQISELFYSNLKDDKVKINWNKNPIKMELFLSFITIDTVKIKDHLGSCNGWTRYENEEHKLIISGGVVDGTDYLNTLQFGEKLSNPYNNYINPFYLFEILTDEGKKFFIQYYKDDINKIESDKINKIQSLKEELNVEKAEYDIILKEMNVLSDLNE